MRTSKKRLLTYSMALLGTGTVIVLATGPAAASHSWSSYHWSRTSTLGIRLGDAVNSSWDSYLRAAATDWSAPTFLDTTVVSSTVSPSTCPATQGRVEVCNAAYGSTGWLGLGSVWTSGGHIVQGTAKLNDTYFSQAKYNTPAWRRYVMCQEIGHTLGLDHQDVNTSNANLGSCMDYTNDPTGTRGTNGTLNNERPNRHDYDQLSTIYGHTDSSQLSSTKVSSGTTAADVDGEPGRRLGQSAIGNTRGDWGRAVASDAKGRQRVFVRDLGNDQQVVTFVIWADDAHEEHTH